MCSLEAVARKCSVNKGVLANFTKFTGKHQCQSLFFNKVGERDFDFILVGMRILPAGTDFEYIFPLGTMLLAIFSLKLASH